MKRLVKIIVILIGIIIISLLAKLVLTGQSKGLEIPSISPSSTEYGQVVNEINKQKNYEIYSEKINAIEFISNEVNGQIENDINSFIADSNTDKYVKAYQKAVYENIIDTYKVNDNIVSIKVTTKVKKLFDEDFCTTINTYNYNISSENKITLDDLFKEGYKEKINDIYADTYLLRDSTIEFYKDGVVNITNYNKLKDYAKSKILTKENFGVSQEEYNNIFKYYIDKNKKMVAITFDDGPHKANTDEILKILQNNNAHATFFMLGQNVTYYPDVVKRVYDSENEIGIHTWNHPQLTKLSESEIKAQISKTSDAIFSITGYRPKLVRPPYGAVNSTVRSAISQPLILWNIDSLDWKSRDEKQIVPLVMQSVQDGDIILLHDIHSTTVPAVEKIVEQLVSQDYQLVTVSELLDAKGYDTTKTKLFYSGRQ